MRSGFESNRFIDITGKTFGRWEVQGFGHKKISLGCYDDISSAIEARKKAENEYFKDFSFQNSASNNL